MERLLKFTIRKLSIGVASVCIGFAVMGPNVSANTITSTPVETVEERPVAEVIDIEFEIPKVEIATDFQGEPTPLVGEVPVEAASIVIVPKDATVTDIVTATQDSFKDDKLTDRYSALKVNERTLDNIAIRTEIAKERNTTFQNVLANDTELVNRIQNYYLDKLTLTDSYNNTKADIEEELTQVVNNTPTVNPDTVKQTISANTGQILTGLAYLNRYYSFELQDGKSAKDIILETPSALDTVLTIGNSTYSELEARNTYRTFQRKIGPHIGYKTLTEFIEAKVGATNIDDWYANTSNAIIVEQKSKDSNINARLYTKMKSYPTLQSHILPLLSLTDPSIYAISTMSSVQFGLTDTYIPKEGGQYKSDDLTKLKAIIEKVAEEQGRYLDTWYRIVNDETKLNLDRAVISIDAMQRYSTDPRSTSSLRWASESGINSTSGIKEFMSPLNHYAKFTPANGEAQGDSIRFYMMRALTPEGNSTYSHEMTHILEDLVWFNGEKSRDGLNTEVFARGLFEVVDNTQENNAYDPIFNLNFLYDVTGKTKRTQNEVPERFQTVDDLKTYMSGVFDVLYTLDYAEAEAALAGSNADKSVWFNKITASQPLAGDRNIDLHVNDKFENITVDEAAKLTDINSLIRNDIVAGRYRYKGINTTGVAIGDQANSYYVIPLFEPIFAAMQNSNGVTGDITVRRQAYELLAEYGYINGMIPYLTNQYKDDAKAANQVFSDDFVLSKIMPEYNGDFETFKKAMFQRRIDSVSNLKPVKINYNGQSIEVDYTKIQELMKEAVAKDLIVMKKNPSNNIAQNVTAVQDLKEAIYRAYLIQSKDFSESIYKDRIEKKLPETFPKIELLELPISVSNMLGELPPTESELLELPISVSNMLGELPPTESELLELPISVSNMLGELPPTESELLELPISVLNMLGELPPTESELLELPISISNMLGELPPTKSELSALPIWFSNLYGDKPLVVTLKPELVIPDISNRVVKEIPKDNVPSVNLLDGDIYVTNLPGELPPTKSELSALPIWFSNLYGDKPLVVTLKPELVILDISNRVVKEIPKDNVPSVNLLDGDIYVTNLTGELPPIVLLESLPISIVPHDYPMFHEFEA